MPEVSGGEIQAFSDDAEKRCRVLSGGEKARLVMASSGIRKWEAGLPSRNWRRNLALADNMCCIRESADPKSPCGSNEGDPTDGPPGPPACGTASRTTLLAIGDGP